MGEFVIGFDIGTQGSKAVLVEKSGKVMAKFQQDHAIEVEKPGYQEESMELWWDELKAAIRYFYQVTGISAEEVKAIGATGLVPALCPVGKDGKSVRKAMLHTDVRAEQELEQINQILPSPISHGCMLPKLMWMKAHEPEHFAQVSKILVPHGYIAYRLTNRAVIDRDTATIVGGLFRMDTLDWDSEMLAAFDLPASILPEVCPATTVIGTVTKEAAEETGLSEQTMVIAGVGDTFASMLGGGAYGAKQLMIYLGTSATVIYAEESPKTYMTVPHYGEGKGHFVGRILSFGESVAHVRNTLGYRDFEELDQNMDGIEAGSEGLWYFPHYKQQNDRSFFGLDAEYILGFRGKHSQYHLYHALMEGIAYNIRHNLQTLTLPVEQINLFGGGANSSKVCQIICNVLGRPIAFNDKSATALGIAFLAAYACGVVKEYEELGRQWLSENHIYEPEPKQVQKYTELYDKYEELRGRLEAVDRITSRITDQ